MAARKGDIAPETGEARIGKFYDISLQGNSPVNAGLLFTAALVNGGGNPRVKAANDFGAWIRTPALSESPRKVVREGDPGFAEGEKIKSF